MSPYQGPPSDYVVVKMIPDNRLPPRHLHSVLTGKTFAVIKWESPYDSPDQDMVIPHKNPGSQTGPLKEILVLSKFSAPNLFPRL